MTFDIWTRLAYWFRVRRFYACVYLGLGNISFLFRHDVTELHSNFDLFVVLLRC